MSRPLALALFVALVVAAACDPPPAPAPEDLEGLAKFFFTRQADASDEELDEAIGNMHGVLVDVLGERDNEVGSLPELTDEELEPVGLAGVNDPSEAPGLFFASRFSCDLGVLEEVLTHPDQATVHPGVYESYQRRFADDRDAWLAGEGAVLSWDVTYSAKPTATLYTAETGSAVRRAPRLERSVGDGVVQRTVLKEPAVFEGEPDNHVFDQDYQLDLYYVGDDEIMHFFALWRRMQLGIVGSDDDVFIELQIDGMIEWDEQLEAACADWPALVEG